MPWRNNVLGESGSVPHEGKYCPVELAPAPAKLRQAQRQQETAQLKTLPYRGSMTPGKSKTYAKRGGVVDPRAGDL